jgi:C4-dicarboxylate-specific signal transduction histidine kinase
MFGAALGLARATPKMWLRILAPVVGFALAILGHAWNNSLPLFFALAAAKAGEAAPTEVLAPPTLGVWEAMVSASITNLIVFLPFALLLAAIIYRSGKSERRVILEELRDEIGHSVTAEEYAAIAADRMFRTRRIDPRHADVSAALITAQNELAFRKRRLKDRGFDPGTDALLDQRRAQIAALRQKLPG